MHALPKRAEPFGINPAAASTVSHGLGSRARRLSPLYPLVPGSKGARRQWLSVREVAQLFEVSRATIYRLIQERRLSHVRISNAVKIHVEQLRAYVQASIVSSE
jgi:excisionase family DNA binding protein